LVREPKTAILSGLMRSGVGIYELVEDARSLDPSAFEAKYGSFFLLRTLDDGNLDTDGFGRPTTQVVRPGELAQQKTRLDTPEASYVYPVIPQSPGEAVTVGRLPDNDISIEDKSLSKVHAQLFVRPDGSLAILDNGSRNGTRVGRTRLEPNVPTAVQFGRTIVFGTVSVTYLPVRQLIDFVRATFDSFEPSFEDPPEVSDSFDIDVEWGDG
jgi:hypothetical protein